MLGGGRVDDLLGVTVIDGPSRLLGEEPTSAFTNIVRSKGTPPGLLGVVAAGGVLLGYVTRGALGSDWVAGCCTVQEGADGGPTHGN